MRIDRPMFEWRSEKTRKDVSRICVFVFLPRYLVDTWPELQAAIRQNKPAIDSMVRVKIEDELLSQKLDIPFSWFFQSKCTLRKDYILEYLFDLKASA